MSIQRRWSLSYWLHIRFLKKCQQKKWDFEILRFWKKNVFKFSKYFKFSFFQFFTILRFFTQTNLKIEEICKKSRRIVCAHLQYHHTIILKVTSIQRRWLLSYWLHIRFLKKNQQKKWDFKILRFSKISKKF